MPVLLTRGIAARGALAAAVAAALACSLFWPAAGAAIPLAPKRSGKLSPELSVLAKPAVRVKSPAGQAAALGVPASGPGSLVREGGRVVVEVRFRDGAIARLPALREAGARVLSASRRYQTATVAVDPGALPALAKVPGVAAVWESQAPIVYGSGSTSAVGEAACEGGSVISEGFGQLRVDEARDEFGLRGKGVTVGVLSDSFDVAQEAAVGGTIASHAHDDVLSGDLPGPAGTCSGQQVPVNVLAEGPPGEGEDEGRAMLQIVHDLAPHASLAFATAFPSEGAFAQNIERLAEPVSEGGAEATVIVDDVGYFNEPFFQDGPVAAAVNKVTEGGVLYLSSAGNDNLFAGNEELVPGEPGIASWEAPEYRDSGECPAPVALLSEEVEELELEIGIPSPAGLHPTHCMDFDPEVLNTDDTFGITVEAGRTLVVDLQWAEPWEGVETDLDAFLLNPAGTKVVAAKFNDNVAKGRPVEVLEWKNKLGTDQEVQLAINRFAGTEKPRLKFALLENGRGVSATEYPQSNGGDLVGPTIFGHAGAASAIAVGAIRFNASKPEAYSSRGPVVHYFKAVEGAAPAEQLGSPEVLEKPDLTATDCGATTFFAEPVGPFWRFCGTSAAAPHAAAVGALLRQGDPAASPQQVREALSESAVPISPFGVDAVGAGLVDALGALEKHEPVGPVDDPPSTVVPPLETEGPNVGPEVETEPAKRPATFISHRPPPLVRTRQRRARVVFRFGSDQAGASFLCRLDAGSFLPCRSPLVRRLRPGPHTFRVKAKAASGLLDATPAVYRFRIERVS